MSSRPEILRALTELPPQAQPHALVWGQPDELQAVPRIIRLAEVDTSEDRPVLVEPTELIRGPIRCARRRPGLGPGWTRRGDGGQRKERRRHDASGAAVRDHVSLTILDSLVDLTARYDDRPAPLVAPRLFGLAYSCGGGGRPSGVILQAAPGLSRTRAASLGSEGVYCPLFNQHRWGRGWRAWHGLGV